MSAAGIEQSLLQPNGIGSASDPVGVGSNPEGGWYVTQVNADLCPHSVPEGLINLQQS